EPPATPHPATIDRIHDRSDAQPIEHECAKLPTLSHRTGRNRSGRVHEYHLEQEQSEYSAVINAGAKEKAFEPDQIDRFAHKVEVVHAVEHSRTAAERWVTAATTKHECKTAHIEAQHAERINHEVHGHRMGRVLRTAQTGFDESETSLHEHDEEASQQRPHDIDRDHIL